MRFYTLIFYFVLVSCLISEQLIAQQLKGKVVNAKNEPISGANIYWQNTTIAVNSDSVGNFAIPYNTEHKQLIVSFVGHNADTIEVVNFKKIITITLVENNILQAVTITDKQSKTFISSINTIKTEVITQGELKRAACCNLSESLSSTASIDVNYADGITGIKQIRMLGLEGVYTQIQTENVALMRGLATNYGLQYIPGTSIQNIALGKGAGSVINGFESMSGQMNIELKKPEASEKLLLNIYANSDARFETNLNASKSINFKWSTGTIIHASKNFLKQDMNKDGFLDTPLAEQASVLHRWSYLIDGFDVILVAKALHENKIGGQTNFTKKQDRTINLPYGLGINTTRFEFFTKTGKVNSKNQNQSIALITNGSYHRFNNFYGINTYTASEKTANANLMFQSNISSPFHNLRAGITYLFDKVNQHYTDNLHPQQINLLRTENIPGIYAEYTYNYYTDLTIVAGVRADYHNTFKWQAAPRLHLKFEPVKNLTIRANGGYGWRIANVLAENPSIFVSSRTLYIEPQLNPEKAWNYGINITKNFVLNKASAYLTFDAYRTHFINQIVKDIENLGEIQFYNLQNKSYSNSFQIEGNIDLECIRTKIAYKIDDVKCYYNGILKQVPLIAQQKLVISGGLNSKNKKWNFDFTANYYNNKRLPNINEIQYSPSAWQLNAQVAYHLANIEVYLGAENLTNYTQQQLIQSPNQPFSNSFDAAIVWGPVAQRMLYCGFRFKIN